MGRTAEQVVDDEIVGDKWLVVPERVLITSREIPVLYRGDFIAQRHLLAAGDCCET
jgi:hypothetical protein